MNKLKLLLALFFVLGMVKTSYGQSLKTEHIFLITLDGLRWEELFGGAVDTLMNDTEYVSDTTALQSLFNASTAKERREKLLPWLWQVIGQQGQLYGNRWLNNKVDCSNSFWFSYPGYNEILVGYSDSRISSNDKVYNPNKTVLEWINEHPVFNGRVAAFGSWDVFPYIINDKRSRIPVNAGYRLAEGYNLTEKEQLLNQLQAEIPGHWSSVRMDAFTQHYALEYLKKKHPRLLYISYGETDDFAHDGRYDQYLKSAHQTDNWIEQLWQYAQSDPFYAGKTTFIITTDHGRGASPKAGWKSHGKAQAGSNAIWIAVLGPDTPALGEVTTNSQLWQNQIAKTLAAFLGFDYTNEKEVGDRIKTVMK
ncbi:MAG: phosphoglyceromutase [Saprospiraceae bacterium]